jgi:transposase InsO family protein
MSVDLRWGWLTTTGSLTLLGLVGAAVIAISRRSFAEAAGTLGVRRSVGRTGSCFDNALAESFNASLKVERVHRTVYPKREHARKDVGRYIEFRYNTKRLHSALGYRTPQEVHNEFLNEQFAA